MGNMQAQAYAALASEGFNLESVLAAHLSSNHYPAIPVQFVPLAVAAIEAGNEGDWDRVLDFPEKCTVDGATSMTARDAIESMHLDSFLDRDDEVMEDWDEANEG